MKKAPLHPLNEIKAEFKAKLKACDSEIQHYVSKLEALNLKLNEQIGQYRAQETNLRHKVKILEDDKKRLERGQSTANIATADYTARLSQLDAEIARLEAEIGPVADDSEAEEQSVPKASININIGKPGAANPSADPMEKGQS